MPFYRRVLPTITACCPFLLEPQAINLALVIEAIRQVPAPKHGLLHRLTRLPASWATTRSTRSPSRWPASRPSCASWVPLAGWAW